MKRLARALAIGLALGGCGADGGSDRDGGGDGGAAGPGGMGVGQGGAQDFGQFRAILDAGEIPGPDTLDDVGFFNEHKIDLPPPTCDGTVCLHGELGVMGNMITGSNCTLLLMGMNTAVDPTQMPRPALNLAIAVDVSGSMSGDSIAFVREGLFRMLDDLQVDDRVSIVAFSDRGEVRAESLAGNSPELALAIEGLAAGGMTNIYDGLRTAYEVVGRNADEEHQNRVILLSDGEATAGITSDTKLVQMSTSYNTLGYALTTIGMGDAFNPGLMRDLSESGSGSFYFLEDPAAVQEVFEEEVNTFLVPLAEDLRISIGIDGAYALRQVYGTKLFNIVGNGALIELPVVQIAHRTSDTDNAGGRRGGGGAIIAELVPRSPSDAQQPGTVGNLGMTYRLPGSEEGREESLQITSPLDPGETPREGHFSGGDVEKAFVMLNIFAGFEMAADRASFGNDRGALGVLDPLAESVELWLEDNPDEDIADDLGYVHKFIDNLEARGADIPPPSNNPPEPWPRD